MGLGQFLKNAVFVDDKATSNPKKTESSIPVNTTIAYQPQFVSQPRKKQPVDDNIQPPSNVNGEIDENIFTELCKIIDESALKTTNYLDLKKNVDQLREILTSAKEEELIKAAYINLKSHSPSFNKAVISSSVDHYLKLIMEQKDAEKNIISEEKRLKVDIPLSKIQEINNEIIELKKQHEEIFAKISNKETEVSTIKNNVESASVNIRKKESDLIATINHMKDLLNGDKNNILNALANVN